MAVIFLQKDSNLVSKGISKTSILTAQQRCMSYQIGLCNDHLAEAFCSRYIKLQGQLLYLTQLVFGPMFGLERVGYLACRTQFLDQVCLNSEPEQCVILGAGMDTRFYRLNLPTGCACFEVDAPPTQAHKRQVGQVF